MSTDKTELSPQALASLHDDPFYKAYNGYFSGILRWEQLDSFWIQVTKNTKATWFIYAVGEIPPENPVAIDEVKRFIREVDQLLRREHDEDYCGIVYANNIEEPTFIKIFDPNNLGTACGSSEAPPLPGWILSQIKPVDLPSAFPLPNNRKRWWKSIFR